MGIARVLMSDGTMLDIGDKVRYRRRRFVKTDAGWLRKTDWTKGHIVEFRCQGGTCSAKIKMKSGMTVVSANPEDLKLHSIGKHI